MALSTETSHEIPLSIGTSGLF